MVDTAAEESYQSEGLYFESLLDLQDFVIKHPKFRAIYTVNEPEEICFLIQIANTTKDLVFLVEEVSQFGGSDAPFEVRKVFKKFVRLARHNRVRIVATSQRPADIDKLLVSESEMLLGNLKEPNDRRYLRDLGHLDKERVDSLASLPLFHFVHFPSQEEIYITPASGV